MKFDQSLRSLSEHLVSCMQIDTSFVPEIYDDLTRCTNEQIIQITGVVSDYYGNLTLTYRQITQRFQKEERDIVEWLEVETAKEGLMEEIVFFN